MKASIHDLPVRLLSHRFGRALFSAVAFGFLMYQASLWAKPLLPGSHAKFPWAMFSVKSGPTRDYRAFGTTAEGARMPIPLERWFRFRRGFSDHTLLFQHPAMQPRRRAARGRAQLARWLAQRLYVEDGIRLDSVELEYRYWPSHKRRMKTKTLARVAIRARDYRKLTPRSERYPH